MSGQLSLGIREQTYYTQENENLVYYLWDGKPFNALPYHTEDKVRIPLIKNYNWMNIQRSYKKRSMLSDQNAYEDM
ncbi:MAG: hypothetical protein H0T62_08175 [Parachlamydiaceae bacterium]|nr:hypothetical protein [Parachlamydiaceae bacterium]